MACHAQEHVFYFFNPLRISFSDGPLSSSVNKGNSTAISEAAMIYIHHSFMTLWGTEWLAAQMAQKLYLVRMMKKQKTLQESSVVERPLLKLTKNMNIFMFFFQVQFNFLTVLPLL